MGDVVDLDHGRDPKLRPYHHAFLRGVAIGCAVVALVTAPITLRSGPGNEIGGVIRPTPASSQPQTPLSAERRAAITSLIDPNALPAPAAVRAETAYTHLSPADAAQFDVLLANAKSNTERAYLYKALAADRTIPDITKFAAQIRGITPIELMALLSPVNEDIPVGTALTPGLHKEHDWSCGVDARILLQARTDPIYALSLNDGVTATGVSVLPAHFGFSDEKVAAAEVAIHDRETAVSAVTGALYQGISVPTVTGELNALSPQTGVTYQLYTVWPDRPADMDWAVSATDSTLDRGIPVPIDVVVDGRVHTIVALAHHGDYVLIQDPAVGVAGGRAVNGVVGWASLRGLFANNPVLFVNLPADRSYPERIGLDNAGVALAAAVITGGIIGNLLILPGQKIRRIRRDLRRKHKTNKLGRHYLNRTGYHVQRVQRRTTTIGARVAKAAKDLIDSVRGERTL